MNKNFKMLKSFTAELLLIFIALASAAPSPSSSSTFKPPTIAQLKACGAAEMVIEERCTGSLPPLLQHSHDLQVLDANPELCCPAHAAFRCIEQGLEKAEACRPVWPLLKAGFDEQMKVFPDNGCHIEKCSK